MRSRLCCSSYFNFAKSSKIVFPSFLFSISSSSQAMTARCTSSMAPVFINQLSVRLVCLDPYVPRSLATGPSLKHKQRKSCLMLRKAVLERDYRAPSCSVVRYCIFKSTLPKIDSAELLRCLLLNHPLYPACHIGPALLFIQTTANRKHEEFVYSHVQSVNNSIISIRSTANT